MKYFPLFILLFGLSLGCKPDRVNSRSSQSSGEDLTANSSKDPEKKKTPEELPPDNSRTVADAGFGFQLMSAKQVQGTIKACLGDELLEVNQKNIIQVNIINPDAFLLQDRFKSGDHIVDVLQYQLDGTESDQRAGTRVAAPSVRYLTALQNIGNLVAFNCERKIANSPETAALCQCGTGQQVSEMFQRCLGQYDVDSQEMRQARLSFASECSLNYRGAIASMISSISFVALP